MLENDGELEMNDWKVLDCYEPLVRFIRLVYCTKTDFQSFVSVSITSLFLDAFVVSLVVLHYLWFSALYL